MKSEKILFKCFGVMLIMLGIIGTVWFYVAGRQIILPVGGMQPVKFAAMPVQYFMKYFVFGFAVPLAMCGSGAILLKK